MDAETDATGLSPDQQSQKAGKRRRVATVLAVVLILTVLVLALVVTNTPSIIAKARAAIRPKPKPAPVVEPAPEPPAPPEFPPLSVTGIIVNGSKSSALINGRTIEIGESIGDMRLVDVHEDYVEMELNGFRHNYPRLGNVPSAAPPHR